LEVERQSELQSLHRDYLERLKQLQASGAASGVELLNVRLQLISSEALLKRSQLANELFKGGYGEAAIAEATARKNLAEARVQALRQELEVAKEGIGRLVIRAPVSGTIISTARRYPGERVASGEALFRISSSNRIKLRLYATEDRIDKVRPGQMVRFRANNNPDRLALLATGTVLEVAEDRDLEAEKQTAGNHASYRIHVQVDNASYDLAIGATVEAEIVIGRRPLWRLIMQRSTDRM
jgi:multidrug resistance efflux pump